MDFCFCKKKYQTNNKTILLDVILFWLELVFRVQDECLLVAHVPLADAEWGRDGPRLCLQKGNDTVVTGKFAVYI